MDSVRSGGREERCHLVSTLLFSIQRNVIGRAAALNKVTSVAGSRYNYFWQNTTNFHLVYFSRNCIEA